VILVDTNVLLYATIDGMPQHDRARRWLSEQFASPWQVGLPWHSLLGFVRLASDRRILPLGPSVDEAWQAVRAWQSAPNAWTPLPTERHATVLNEMFSTMKIATREVMDVHLAALAVEHGLTLCSADTGFGRYRNLRWFNPLE